MLVMLALATHVTSARADGITQTAITSPSDPSYFYDSTNGAYGGFTVTGTTNITGASDDQVDIDCYHEGSSGFYDAATLVSGVSLDSDGGFSTTVSYSDMEGRTYDDDGTLQDCQLIAVPTGTDPTDLSTFSGPRVMLAVLVPSWYYADGSQLWGETLTAPQLDATDNYSAGQQYDDCGVTMSPIAPDIVGTSDQQTFSCAQSIDNFDSELDIDGQPATVPMNGETMTASQNPSNGDMTIHETLQLCTDATCPDGSTTSNVVDDRSIEQTDNGKLAVVTDVIKSLKSADGSSQPITYNVSSDAWMSNDWPGDALTFSALNMSSGFPQTVYVNNPSFADGSTAMGQGAITLFNRPDSMPTTLNSDELEAPYTLNLPAGGSVSLSYAYSTEFTQSDFAADIAKATDIQSPPTINIAAPSSGASVATGSVVVSGSVSANSGVSSVTVDGVAATVSGSTYTATVPLTVGPNTISAVATSNLGETGSATETVNYLPSTPGSPSSIRPTIQASAGSLWLPIANTGNAHRVASLKERLSGQVTAGSGAVKYYFEYGARGHLNHRSKTVALAAGKTSQSVALTIGGLSHGTKYSYRLVATGTYGNATGSSRSFKTTARHK